MNTSRHLRTLPAAFMLVLFLAVSCIGAEGTLLCFGKDGHVAIEFVKACNRAWSDTQFEGAESDACGPCRDIQLLSSPADTSAASPCMKTLPLTTLSRRSPVLLSKEDAGRNICLSPYPHHKTLAGLHSVVLLI